jgi:hypothetical protein
VGEGPRESSNAWAGLAGVGVVALAIGCCGALPLAVAIAGSVAIGTVLGVAAGAVALIVLVTLVVVRVRRRSACEAPAPRHGDQSVVAKKRSAGDV